MVFPIFENDNRYSENVRSVINYRRNKNVFTTAIVTIYTVCVILFVFGFEPELSKYNINNKIETTAFENHIEFR